MRVEKIIPRKREFTLSCFDLANINCAISVLSGIWNLMETEDFNALYRTQESDEPLITKQQIGSAINLFNNLRNVSYVNG